MSTLQQAYPFVAVGGLIFAPDGTFLLVRSHKWNNLYTLAGGKVDCGEGCEKAFVREILEETGLHITNIRFAMVQDSIYNPQFIGNSHFIMIDYVADLDSSCRKEDVTLNEEAQEYLWVTPNQALTLPLSDEVRHLLHWYLSSQNNCYGLLGVKDLVIDCIVGVYEEERMRPQPLVVDIECEVDWSLATNSDSLGETTNYAEVAKAVKKKVQTGRYQLLETLCLDVLKDLHERFAVTWTQIYVRKPHALDGPAVAWASLTRGKRRGTK